MTETRETCPPCPGTGITRTGGDAVSKGLLVGPMAVKLLCAPVADRTNTHLRKNIENRLRGRECSCNLTTPGAFHVGELLGEELESRVTIRAGNKDRILFHRDRYRFSRPIRPDRRSNYSVLIVDRSTGRRRRISLRAPRLDEALRNLADLRALLESGSVARTGPTLAEVFEQWVESLRGRVREATLATAESWCRRWLKNFPGYLNEITTEYLTKYFTERQRQYAQTTLNLEIHMLRWFWGWACESGIAEGNPAVKVRTYTVPETRRQMLTDAEWARVFSRLEADHRFGGLVRVALYTGLRIRTILGLRWGMFTGSDTWLAIPAELLKSKRPFRAPLFPEATAAVRSLRGDFPPMDETERLFHYDPKTISRKWNLVSVRAGVPLTKFHSIRAAFVTKCRQRGIQLEIAMRLSDHVDVKTFLKVYRQVQDSDLELAVRGGAGESAGREIGGGEVGGSGI